MQRKTKIGLAPGKMTQYVVEPGLQIAAIAGNSGVWELAHEILYEIGGIAQLDGAYALVGRGEQYLPEVAFSNRVTNREALSTVAIGQRGHSKLCAGILVHTAG